MRLASPSSLQVPGLPGVYFREETVRLRDRDLAILTASAVDVLASAARGPIPYWPVAWPAGLGLARHLSALDLGEQRVLEVGCGVGIAGLGAALAGAETLVTDNQPPALRLACMNARRAGLNLSAAAADWRQWPFRRGCDFDLVIGSDVTYEPAAFDALLQVLDDSLRLEGTVLLSDPGRLMTTAFHQRAIAAGWTWSTETLPREGTQSVFLHRMTRRPKTKTTKECENSCGNNGPETRGRERNRTECQ